MTGVMASLVTPIVGCYVLIRAWRLYRDIVSRG